MIHNMVGGGASLNFKVVGNPQPANPSKNTIWIDTDNAFPNWYFDADEPEVYNIPVRISSSGSNDARYLIAPHKLTAGDVLNLTISDGVSSAYEAIRIVDEETNRDYCVRNRDGTAVRSWPAGTKVGLVISNDKNKIGSYGDNGTAYIYAWESYYHEEGTLWIQTGMVSPAKFNALKKNGIHICPLSAKQYVSGAWVDKDAKSYQGGAWVDWWAGELYKNGDEFKYVTGGWIPYQMSYVIDVTAVNPRITKNGDSVTVDISQGGANGGSYITENKIPFNGKKSLVFTGTASGDNTEHCCVAIWSEVQRDFAQNRIATYNFGSSFSGNATIDVSSLDGEYYVGIHVYGMGNAQVTMQEMKLV